MADNFNISDVPESAGPKSVEVPGDIADGTAGELMTWDAGGVASLVAVGTATDVLTSNGAGAAPTYQPAGGAPVASVFSRTGVVVAVAGDYAASIVTNDSGVAGAFVDDALDNLAAAIPPAAPVDSVFGRTGVVVAVSGDYDFTEISGTITAAQHAAQTDGTLHAAVIAAGASGFMTGADKTKLDGISAAPVDSVFTRTGAVVAAASDYDASQVDNDSNIAGAFVDDALNNLDNAGAQARRTTLFTLPTVYGDITLDATDVETNSAIVNHDGVTTDRIDLVLAGMYEIHYHFEVGPSSDVGSGARIEARVRVNDTTVLNGSAQYTSIHNDSSLEGQNHVDGLACSFLYEATAADFITLQAQMVILAGTPDPDLIAGTIVMTAKRMTQ